MRATRCFLGPLIHASLPDDLRDPLEANSSTLPVGDLPFDPPCFRESGPDLRRLDFLS